MANDVLENYVCPVPKGLTQRSNVNRRTPIGCFLADPNALITEARDVRMGSLSGRWRSGSAPACGRPRAGGTGLSSSVLATGPVDGSCPPRDLGHISWLVSWVGMSVAGAVLRGSFSSERIELIPEMLLADPRPWMRETCAEHHFVGPDGDEAADSLPV